MQDTSAGQPGTGSSQQQQSAAQDSQQSMYYIALKSRDNRVNQV